MKNEKITILIPAKNSKSTIINTLESLEILNEDLVEEVIYIDDASIDGSLEMVRYKKLNSKFKYSIIENKLSQGLAKNYNRGISLCKSRYMLTVHQDIEIIDSKSLEKSIEAFKKKSNCVLVTSDVVHPEFLYPRFNFWMKAQFSRIIGRKSIGFSGGKFDCYDLSLLDIFFDSDNFKTSGEDVALVFILHSKGFTSASSDVQVIHNHNLDPKYSFKSYLRKENQMNETYGALFRKFGFKKNKISSVIAMFHRMFLVGLIIIPYSRFFGFVLVLIYIFYYSKRVFRTEYRDPRIILVPFANLLVLFSGAIWNIIGFARGKQTL